MFLMLILTAGIIPARETVAETADQPEIVSLDYNVSTTLLKVVMNVPASVQITDSQSYFKVETVTDSDAGSITATISIMKKDAVMEPVDGGVRVTLAKALSSVLHNENDLPRAGQELQVRAGLYTSEDNHVSENWSQPKVLTVQPVPLDDGMVVTLTPDTFVYSGSGCEPKVAVVTSFGKKLRENRDFTVSFRNHVDVGTATAVITGIRNYFGTLTKTFSITAKPDSEGSAAGKSAREPAAIKASDVALTVSKKTRSFYLHAVTNGGTLTYVCSNKNIAVDGAGKVTVKKNFIGEAVITITAAETNEHAAGRKSISITVNPPKTRILSAKNNVSKKILVRWKKSSFKGITGYQIRLSLKKDFSAKVRMITVKGYQKTSKVISGLKYGKAYYVQVRTFKKKNGTQFCSAWSKARKVRIRR